MDSQKDTHKQQGLSPSSIRIGKRYRASRVDSHYDAIVIGSGIGGLTTAACLAKAGKKVIVLEQHYTAGGFTHSYARNGYEWDVGVHYIGDMGAPTMGRKLFDYITDGELKWSPMADCYDRVFVGEHQFDLVAGKKNFVEGLKNSFPNDHEAIDKYMELLNGVASNMKLYSLAKLLPETLNSIAKPFVNKKLPSYFNKTTHEVLSTITDNQELIAVLTAQWGDCGVPPKQSSFFIHSTIAKHYLHGGFYPVGGASKMAETIIPVIQQGGGDVYTYADVRQIVFDGKRAQGVEMADGHVIRAPMVISNAGVFNTFEKLVPAKQAKQSGYTKKLKTVKPSMGHFCLYIGLKAEAESLGLPQTNYWIYPSADHQANLDAFYADQSMPFPLTYISFPSAKDPAFLSKYPGRATIEIVAPAAYKWFEQWKDHTWGKRGEDYETIKEAYSQRLLQTLYQHFPQLEGKIDYYELSTPLSTDYFCRYGQGEIYGLDHTPERFEQAWLRPKTKIPGLYLTGQDVLSCGVVGAAIAGAFCAVGILGLKSQPLLRELLSRSHGEIALVDMAGHTSTV